MFRAKRVRAIIAGTTIVTTAIFPSCGSSSSSPPMKATLQSIAVSPAAPQLVLGANQQFTATGKLTDGSTQDLTQTATWSSSDSTVVFVNNSAGRIGMGNTRGPGMANISASNGTITGTTVATVTRRTPAFLYAANHGANTISAFTVNPATGALTAISGSPFPTPIGDTSIAVSRDFKFLYAADFGLNQISAFSVNSDGSLSPLLGTPFPAGSGPVSVVTHPAADFLYVSNQGSGEIMVFIIDPQLTSSTSVAIGNAPLFGTMTSDGTRFYQTVSALAQISGFSVSANGSLTPISGSPFSTGFFPRTIAIDPAGKFLYATISSSFMGASTAVYAYTIDATSGALTAIPGSPFPAGENPVSAAVDVSGRFLFVANNANTANGNSVSAFSIDPNTGVLTRVSGSPFAASPFPLFVAVDPSGQYVYVGLDSSPGIAAFVINQVTGGLTPMLGSPFPGNSVWSMGTTY
jgi:6-phosphogluconolactonase (cycloisomerase 2 family)